MRQTASVIFLGRLNFAARKLLLSKIKITADWRGLCPVYLRMLQNLVFRCLEHLSVSSQGQNYPIHTFAMEEP